MFFFEWVIPLLLVIVVGCLVFYLSVRNRVNAGVRTEGKTYVDKPTEDDSPRTLE